MRRTDTLGGLIRLQQLRERRQQAAVAQSSVARQKCDNAYKQAERDEAEACAAFETLNGQLPFKLDHRQLLAAFVTDAAGSRHDAALAKTRASEKFLIALASLGTETARSRKLREQHMQTKRRSDAKQDEVNLRTLRSLHVALAKRILT